MKQLKPIVTDTYDFPTLIREGYMYVDKTELLRRMISGVDGRFFFMSRPRRFGKSLMISTLEQIFKGEKSLFRGLAISKSNYDWRAYPIIRLDMTAFDHTSGLAQFKRSLAKEFGGKEPISAFRSFIAKKAAIANGKGVVILIDEYDSPVSGLLGKTSELEEMREFLQSFYRILKLEVGSIRFLMMTGVSKFTKLSVFSGLNNLTDLSMDSTYAGLLGYTLEELQTFLSPQIENFAKETGRTTTAVVEELLSWYDSYRFSPESEIRVCNPVSVGRALKKRSCEAFWDRTGSSTLIVERLRKAGKLPFDTESLVVAPKRLDVCDLQKLPLDSLMYQGGYLTIKSVLDDGKLVLGIPNREVREAVYGGFLDEVLEDESDNFSSAVYAVRKLLNMDKADMSSLNKILSSVFAMVPHEWKLKSEAEAKRYFLLFMKMAGADITPELESSKGRADAVVETKKTIYIFEFKYGKTARVALGQIAKQGYAEPYATDRRKVVCIGLNYNVKTASIDEPLIVEPINGGVSGPVNRRGWSSKSRGGGPANLGGWPSKSRGGGPTSLEGGPVKLFEAIRANPGLRKTALSRITGISERSIKRYLVQLKSRVEFRGATKNGGYYARRG